MTSCPASVMIGRMSNSILSVSKFFLEGKIHPIVPRKTEKPNQSAQTVAAYCGVEKPLPLAGWKRFCSVSVVLYTPPLPIRHRLRPNWASQPDLRRISFAVYEPLGGDEESLRPVIDEQYTFSESFNPSVITNLFRFLISI